MEVFEGNPTGKAIWDWVWKQPIMQPGQPGTPVTFGDQALVLKKNIEQIYGECWRWSMIIATLGGKAWSSTSKNLLSTHPLSWVSVIRGKKIFPTSLNLKECDEFVYKA